MTGIITFAVGFAISFAMPAPAPATQTAAAVIAPLPSPQPRPAGAELDALSNVPLLSRGSAVISALRESDYAALSRLVHPKKGLELVPYSTVDPSTDLTLTAAQIAGAAEDAKVYTFGTLDGKGTPLSGTLPDYFASYVYNADYATAPLIGVDTVQETGNALENVIDAFPDARFIEYHFPGLDPANEGFDWCSLKLVFEVYNNDWYLISAIHSEWTI